MATIKIRFRPSTVRDRYGTLYYQVIHLRMVRQVYTGYHLDGEEWDGASQKARPGAACDGSRAVYLSQVNDGLRAGLARFRGIVERLDGTGHGYTVEDVVTAYAAPDTVTGVISYARNLIDDLRRLGKKSMARRYGVTVASLSGFTEGGEVSWSDFSSTFVLGYEEHLRQRGLCRNTTSFYMRNLRSIINRASECGYEVRGNPFRHVYMGIDKTVKRAVSLRTVCRIRDMDLSGSPHLDFARNVFMFSFYTRGMSFVDMAFLKKSDVSNGTITYFRRKTRQRIQIKVEEPIRHIMDKLGESSTSYQLPLIGSDTVDAYDQYRSIYHRVNRNLRKLGDMLGLDLRLTMYVARHAWASIAHHNDIPIATISRAMGHDSETTTQIYLSTIDMTAVDNANRKIMTLMQG